MIDLGSAQKAGKPVKGYTGSYVAPEAMGAGVKAQFSADMFSVGIYLLKLLSRGAPVKWNFPGPTLDFGRFTGSDEAKALVKSLTTYDVKARLTVKQALCPVVRFHAGTPRFRQSLLMACSQTNIPKQVCVKYYFFVCL